MGYCCLFGGGRFQFHNLQTFENVHTQNRCVKVAELNRGLWAGQSALLGHRHVSRKYTSTTGQEQIGTQSSRLFVRNRSDKLSHTRLQNMQLVWSLHQETSTSDGTVPVDSNWFSYAQRLLSAHEKRLTHESKLPNCARHFSQLKVKNPTIYGQNLPAELLTTSESRRHDGGCASVVTTTVFGKSRDCIPISSA